MIKHTNLFIHFIIQCHSRQHRVIIAKYCVIKHVMVRWWVVIIKVVIFMRDAMRVLQDTIPFIHTMHVKQHICCLLSQYLLRNVIPRIDLFYYNLISNILNKLVAQNIFCKSSSSLFFEVARFFITWVLNLIYYLCLWIIIIFRFRS